MLSGHTGMALCNATSKKLSNLTVDLQLNHGHQGIQHLWDCPAQMECENFVCVVFMKKVFLKHKDNRTVYW